MRYRFYHGDVLIGYSELESDDSSMGIRIGRFHPADGYAVIGGIYREFSMVRFEEHFEEHHEQRKACDPDKLDQLRARREQLQKLVDEIRLRLETEDGQPIGTTYICIEDFSEELGEHEREVTIMVDDHTTYEQFFGCAP